jgi:hypothetical protein
MIEFKIHPKELSLNSLYSGRFWTFRAKWAKAYHKLVNEKCIEMKFPMFKKPVIVTIYFNNKFDIDNNSIMAKFIIDGLKDTVIKDDNRKYVSALYLEFYDEQGIKVEVREK